MYGLLPARLHQRARSEVPMRPPSERKLDFLEMSSCLSEEQAKAEALRCLRCGVCSECNQCVYACRAGAFSTTKWSIWSTQRGSGHPYPWSGDHAGGYPYRVWLWTFPQRGDQLAIRAHLIRLWAILRSRTATFGWKTPSQGGVDPVRRFA